MMFDLGAASELIRVTADYSNAMLVAVMPYFSDVAQTLNLPVPNPMTAANVSYCGILPRRDVVECGVTFKGGWTFSFGEGHVRGFSSPNAYYGLQDPSEIPKFFGTVLMSKEDAVRLARHTIKKLNIPLEAVFAEQEPRVKDPLQIGTNTVPRYFIEWLDPRSGVVGNVRIEVNAESRRVESLGFASNKNLARPPPKINVIPPDDSSVPRLRPVNPEYALRLIPIVLNAIDEYGKKLSLPISIPLTTNHVARFQVADNGGWPHSEIELTNGWRFIYRNNMVNGYYTPDNLFNSDRRSILIKDFMGKPNMTESEAIDLVRRTMDKFNFPTNLVHTDFSPKIIKSSVPGIPRCSIYWWHTSEDLRSKVEAEVDLEKRELKSLYYDDKAYWNKPPPIDVPITLPSLATSSAVFDPKSNVVTPKPPPRPFAPFDSMPKK